MKRFHPSLLIVVILAGVAFGDVQLVLRDGRVLDGKDVVRQQNQYMLEIGPDEVMSIPVELVVEVRLLADEAQPMTGIAVAKPATLTGSGPAENAPTGIEVTEPRNVVGPEEPVESPSIEEALEVLGEPAKFRRGTLDPYWKPKSVFTRENDVTQFNPVHWLVSPIDASWGPESAFTREGDVTEFNPARWAESIMRWSWYPEDGFKRKAAFWSKPEPTVTERAGAEVGAAISEICTSCPNILDRPDFDADPAAVAEEIAAAKRVAARDCAIEVFQPLIDAAGAGFIWRVQAELLDDDGLAGLPITIYEGRLTLGETVHLAWLTVEGGECGMLRGGRDLLVSVGVAEGDEPAYAERIYNAAIRKQQFAPLENDDEKLEYAVTLLSLVEFRFQAVVVRSVDQFEALLAVEPEHCSMSSRKFRRERTRARSRFAEPEVASGADVDVVRLMTWTAQGGVLTVHTLYLHPDGSFSSYHDPVAECLGPHRDANSLGPDDS